MTWIQRRAVPWLACALVALVVASCGSGAIDGPRTEEQALTTAPSTTGLGTTGTAPATSSSGAMTSAPAKERWRWGLPLGDTSPAELERAVYKALQMSCAAGQAKLDELWEDFRGPTSVLIFQAGIHVCREDRTAARSALARAGEIGLTGVKQYETVCKVYKATLSVLDQKDPAMIACSTGELPRWPQDQDPDHRDDPRTGRDESKASSTTTLRTGTTTTVRLSTTVVS